MQDPTPDQRVRSSPVVPLPTERVLHASDGIQPPPVATFVCDLEGRMSNTISVQSKSGAAGRRARRSLLHRRQ